ncbi:long-chain fatty acid--CoA ligase [Nonomuraea sp. KC401]|uniref:Long-chain fatty acid--CoA ligase n=1 Tax=Nonomuraea longispora TaxID=1848320 RepID=A0A4V2XJE7_9ACTN|nr:MULTISPECIES: long-chain fatty acid--CoA ligase [Nonomuraea]NBE94335.1 AMP-binding protein [Nonomuraea sp. K271]TDC02346.1 long-chain fatty acid--CoA ligase [Nonomuraea longispora]TLF73132.1 long-chain fatty acid--CoA ligase [Nonomuraea sp. KC401]
MNLADRLLTTAERLGGRAVLTLDEAELTYGGLEELSARLAGLLRCRGIGPGDRVAIMLPNVPEFGVVYYGVLRVGAVVVPLDPLLKRREIAAYLGDCGARLLIAWHAFAETAEAGSAGTKADCFFVVPEEFRRLLRQVAPDRDVAATRDDDTAVIHYTSGTTGRPKGVELSHANLAVNAATVARMHALGVDDVVLGALPLYHTFGQTCALNATVQAGARLTLLRRFEAGRALEVIRRDGVTVFQGVPTMFIALLDHPGASDLSMLRVCASGGAALPLDVLRAYETRFGCEIIEGYGLSETSPVAATNRAGHHRRPGSIGWPIRGVEMKIVDEDGAEVPPGEIGEVVVRGPNVMKGYWNDPSATAEAVRDGWFHTGDLGRVDEDGYFFLVDRRRDVIIRGGYTVYPREVEEVLYEHPAVRQAAVYGVPHPELGEEIEAAVALRAPVTREDLRDFVKERVAAYKYPRRLSFVDELPLSPTGKILKRALTRTPSGG